jgi:hypothetical protein
MPRAIDRFTITHLQIVNLTYFVLRIKPAFARAVVV